MDKRDKILDLIIEWIGIKATLRNFPNEKETIEKFYFEIKRKIKENIQPENPDETIVINLINELLDKVLLEIT